MRVFQLLAVVPLGASLVAAAAIAPVSSGELISARGEAAAPNFGSVLVRREDVNPQNNVTDENPFGKDPLNADPVKPLKEVKDKIEKEAQVKGKLTIKDSMKLYQDVASHANRAVNKLKIHFKLKFKTAEGSVSFIVKLKQVMDVTTDANNDLTKATMDSATKINVKTIQRDQPQAIAEFQEVFVGLQSILELIVDEKGNLHGAFYAQFDLFIDSLQAFIDSHKIYATGLIAQLRAQVLVISDLVKDAQKGQIKDGKPVGPASCKQLRI